MKERIEAIIQHEQLTPSQFADKIGVQRSGVSHILSGRNKPSVDFLNKLLTQFPHISGDWLITGQGQMLIGGKIGTNKSEQLSLGIKPKTGFKMPPKELKEEKTTQYQTKEQPKPPQIPQIASDESKQIERIIIFYKDKSFVEYRPES